MIVAVVAVVVVVWLTTIAVRLGWRIGMVMESKDLIGIDCDLNDLVHRLHCSVLPLMEVPSLSLPCPTFQYWCLVACGCRWLRICSLLASSLLA